MTEMNKDHAKISIGKGVGPTVFRFNLGQILSCRDFLMAGALAILVTLGVLGVGDAFAQTPPGGIPSAKTTIARTAPAKVAVTDEDREFMQLAIDKMRQAGVVDKTGGPFGAVIVLNGKVISVAGNSVMKDKDPTAHGAVLYSSCECCPLCYAAAYWARVGKIFYAASWSDYSDVFDDTKLSKDICKPYNQRQLAPQQILQSEAQKVWQEFKKMPDGARY
jgi:tRNA(Arg) A34 adenosine deaminase TadA